MTTNEAARILQFCANYQPVKSVTLDEIREACRIGAECLKEDTMGEVLKIRYHTGIDELVYIGGDKSDWIDLRCSRETVLGAGEDALIPLGVSIQLPQGYEAIMVPRSSTYRYYGIIMSNSVGVIDESYCGDGDQWHFPAIAMRDTMIPYNARIAQFRIFRHQPNLAIQTVEHLDGVDRGGIGSTGNE